MASSPSGTSFFKSFSSQKHVADFRPLLDFPPFRSFVFIFRRFDGIGDNFDFFYVTFFRFFFSTSRDLTGPFLQFFRAGLLIFILFSKDLTRSSSFFVEASGTFLRDTKTKRKILKTLRPKSSLWLRPFLARWASYSQHSSDTTCCHTRSQKATECEPHACQDQLNHAWATNSEYRA